MRPGEPSKLSKLRDVLLICPDRRIIGELTPLISQHMATASAQQLTAYPARENLAEMLGAKPPTLCFLDMATDRASGFAVLGHLAALAPGLTVVVVIGSNEPELILSCLRSGAAEFLIRPVSNDQFQPVFDRLSQLRGSAREVGEGCMVYCVMPVKGSCGASTVACHLAMSWRNRAPRQILLADLDPLAGLVGFLLKLKSNYSFLDVLSREGAFDADVWKRLVLRYQDADVLLSPENPLDASREAVNPRPIIDFARQLYEIIVVDTCPPRGPWTAALAELCDRLLLVTTAELSALRATQRVLAALDRQGVARAKIRLLVNRHRSDAGISPEAIETAVHADVFHTLPSDGEAIRRTLVENRPVAPGTKLGKSFNLLVDRLKGRPGEFAPAKKRSFGWAALISGLVSRVSP